MAGMLDGPRRAPRSGGAAKQLTNGTTVFEHEWSADGTRIACACAPRNTVDDSYMFQRLHVLGLRVYDAGIGFVFGGCFGRGLQGLP